MGCTGMFGVTGLPGVTGVPGKTVNLIMVGSDYYQGIVNEANLMNNNADADKNADKNADKKLGNEDIKDQNGTTTYGMQ